MTSYCPWEGRLVGRTIYGFIMTGHRLLCVTILVKEIFPVVLLDGGHDLDVLEGAMCCVVVRVATGNACAVAHSDRGGGQLSQALVLAIHRQLVNVKVCDLKALLLGQLQHHLNIICVGNTQRVSPQ